MARKTGRAKLWLIVGATFLVVAVVVLAITFPGGRAEPEAPRYTADALDEPSSELVARTGMVPRSTLDLPEHWNSAGAPISDDAVLRIDSACAQASGIDALASVSDNLRRRLSITRAVALQEQAMYTERTRFWERDGVFYQLTAVWNRDMPARYDIEFYQSPSARFDEDVAHAPFPLALANPQAGLDTAQVDDLFDWLGEDARSAGVQPGAEILVSRVLDDIDGSLHELTTLNGHLINWSFPEGLCLVDGSGDFLDCNCEAGSTPGHRH